MYIVLTKPLQAFDPEPTTKYVCSPDLSYTWLQKNSTADLCSPDVPYKGLSELVVTYVCRPDVY